MTLVDDIQYRLNMLNGLLNKLNINDRNKKTLR